MLIHFFNQINRQFNTKFITSIMEMEGFSFLNFKLFVQTMVLNLFLSKCALGFMKIELFINIVVLGPPKNDVLQKRKHQHLLDVARALRFQANLPISVYDECILTAAFLINKLPTSILQYKSPHQSFNSNCTVIFISSLCFAKNINIRHKFDEIIFSESDVHRPPERL